MQDQTSGPISIWTKYIDVEVLAEFYEYWIDHGFGTGHQHFIISICEVFRALIGPCNIESRDSFFYYSSVVIEVLIGVVRDFREPTPVASNHFGYQKDEIHGITLMV